MACAVLEVDARLLLLNQQGDECLVASIDPGFGSAQQITQSYTTIEQALAVLNPTDAGQTMHGKCFLAAYSTDRSVHILVASRVDSIGDSVSTVRDCKWVTLELGLQNSDRPRAQTVPPCTSLNNLLCYPNSASDNRFMSLQPWNHGTRTFFSQLDGWCPPVYLGCCERLETGDNSAVTLSVWLDPCDDQLTLDAYWLESDSARFAWLTASLGSLGTGLEHAALLRAKVAAHTGLEASIHLLDTSNPEDRSSLTLSALLQTACHADSSLSSSRYAAFFLCRTLGQEDAVAALATTFGDILSTDDDVQPRVPVLINDKDNSHNHTLSYLITLLAVQVHQQQGTWLNAEAWTAAARGEPFAKELRQLICSTTLRAAAIRDTALAPFQSMARWVDPPLLHASWCLARGTSLEEPNPALNLLQAKTDPVSTSLPSQHGQEIYSLPSTITVTVQGQTLALTHSLAAAACLTHVVLTLPQRSTKAARLHVVDRCVDQNVLDTALPDDFPLAPLYFKLPAPCTTTSLTLKLEFDEPPSAASQNAMQSCVCGQQDELDMNWEQLFVESLSSQLPAAAQLVHCRQGLVAHLTHQDGSHDNVPTTAPYIVDEGHVNRPSETAVQLHVTCSRLCSGLILMQGSSCHPWQLESTDISLPGQPFDCVFVPLSEALSFTLNLTTEKATPLHLHRIYAVASDQSIANENANARLRLSTVELGPTQEMKPGLLSNLHSWESMLVKEAGRVTIFFLQQAVLVSGILLQSDSAAQCRRLRLYVYEQRPSLLSVGSLCTSLNPNNCAMDIAVGECLGSRDTYQSWRFLEPGLAEALVVEVVDGAPGFQFSRNMLSVY